MKLYTVPSTTELRENTESEKIIYIEESSTKKTSRNMLLRKSEMVSSGTFRFGDMRPMSPYMYLKRKYELFKDEER